VAIYKEGPVFEVVAIDSAGQHRQDWAATIRQRPLRAQRVADETNESVDWAGLVRRLGKQLDATRRPHALAAILMRPPRA
jgi:hypothetical protein